MISLATVRMNTILFRMMSNNNIFMALPSKCQHHVDDVIISLGNKIHFNLVVPTKNNYVLKLKVETAFFKLSSKFTYNFLINSRNITQHNFLSQDLSYVQRIMLVMKRSSQKN